MLTCEQVTRSLLKEFLIRSKMAATAKQFDLEYQGISAPISRIDLVKGLCLEKIVKINKEKELPRSTLVEMLIDYLLERSNKSSKSTVQPGLSQIKEENTSGIGSITNSQHTIIQTSNSDGNIIKNNQSKAELQQQSEVQETSQNNNGLLNFKNKILGSRLKKMRKAPSQEQTVYQQSQGKQLTVEEGPVVTIPKSTSKVEQQDTILQNINNNKPREVSQGNQEPNKVRVQNQIVEQNQFINDLDELDNMFDAQKLSEPPSEANQTQEANKKVMKEPIKMMNLQKKSISSKDTTEKTDNQNKEYITSNEQPTDTIMNVEVIEYQPINLEETFKIDVRAEDLLQKINYNKSASSQQNNRRKKNQQSSIDPQSLQGIKKTIFGNSGFNSLPKSWGQGFMFLEDKTFYGLLQKEGGPCGMIAVVQCYYLKHLLIIAKGNKPNIELKQNCLIAAIADILFKLSKLGTGKIVIAISARQSNPSEAIALDACDQISFPATSLENTFDQLYELKDLFIGENNNGVTLLFYSTILTKGIEIIKKEMDNEDNSLIGNHGHCTQEMVNLLLTGIAVSNCFDGDKVLDENYVLHGIKERSEFGFLTIFEHFKYMEVGGSLKSPQYPIWVICKEYHYSVIFATSSTILMNTQSLQESLKHFDLIFFDELYAPNDQIRLTIRRNGSQLGNKKKQMDMGGGLTFNLGENDNDDLTPSIELVLRTKWGSDLEVDWNDSMPIL